MPTPSPAPIVDVHHHFLPRAVFERLRAEAGGGQRLVNDRISITLSADLPDVEEHLRVMDGGGVDAAILTYSGVSLLGPEVCTALNDGFAEVQASAPGRLFGSVHVSLHDPAAPREIERGIRELGLVAVALPTSELGLNLDDPSLMPLWEMIAGLDVPVILHPALLPKGATTDYGLERSCARPFDTTLAAARLAYGVLPRVPGVRVVLPHLGGTAIFLRGRLAMFYEPPSHPERGLPKTVREQRAAGWDRLFEEAWSGFYYDTAGTGGWPQAIEMAARVVGADRLLFGTDFPLESHSTDTVRELVDVLQALQLAESERQAVGGLTARSLFRLPVARSG